MDLKCFNIHMNNYVICIYVYMYMCIYLEAVGVVFYFEVEINTALEIGNTSATLWVVQSLFWTAQWYVYYDTGNVVFVLYYLLPAKLTCPLKINGWKIYFLLKWSLF